jgi:UDP:flavonoid glycosyltransferase YjiC (YdhE family)
VGPDTKRAPIRILFIAEAVTLAHVARSFVLARSLDRNRFDVHLAWDARFNTLLGEMLEPFYPLQSLPTEEFLRRLSRSYPMHDTGTLRSYVRDDLATIETVKPDVIVGDFRLSLAVSAQIAGVPLVTVANAYWSPFRRQTFVFPEYDYPLSRIVGQAMALRLFPLLRPLAFATHTAPLNAVLREHGLPPIGRDVRTMYTYGDCTAYADIPELVPIENLPPSHRYIGAVLWSPSVPFPAWWDDLPADKPIVYVTLGSSGDALALPKVLEALADLPITVIASTAGRIGIRNAPTNARITEFLPGIEVARRAALVICNGGSPTTYQALAAGTPVLGLVSNNMDQHLNMEAVRRVGAGEVLRGRDVDTRCMRETVLGILQTDDYAAAAKVIANAHREWDSTSQFAQLVDDVLREPNAAGRIQKTGPSPAIAAAVRARATRTP